jgi:hypothetical protein
MDDKKMAEEIIELTDVIEEPEPQKKSLGESLGLTMEPLPNEPVFEREEHVPEVIPRKPEPAEGLRPSLPGDAAEIQALQERWNERVEAWFAKEGIPVLERIARETFPKIAEKVLREEIEKMKAEVEEQE